MEPAVELAVRIVGHLWLLRPVFPGSSSVKDLPQEWEATLLHAARSDYALARQIADLAAPVVPLKNEEAGRYRGTNQPLQPVSPEAGPKPTDLYAEAVARFARHVRDLAAEDGFAPEVLRFRGFVSPASSSGSASTELENLTREQVSEDLSNAMLSNPPTMRRAALALEYTPQLVRAVGASVEDGLEWTNPDHLKDMADNAVEPVPLPFSMVQREELGEIVSSRRLRLTHLCESALPPASPWRLNLAGEPRDGRMLPRQQAFDMCLFGVALSGGGIRSATFSLGVLQALADAHMLPFVDCLSTVSGGGYIGSWLMAWTKRRGSVASVQDSMRGYGSNLPCKNAHGKKTETSTEVSRNHEPLSDYVRPIRFLREFSRYLAPEAGFFSADSWTILSTWLRNTFLNLLVLATFLGSVLLLPRAAAWVLLKIPSLPVGNRGIGFAGGVLLLAACFLIAFKNLGSFAWRRGTRSSAMRGDDEPLVVSSILVLILGGAFLCLTALWAGHSYRSPEQVAILAAVVYLIGVSILWIHRVLAPRAPGVRLRLGVGWELVAILVSSALGTGLMYLLCRFFEALAKDSESGTWIALTVGLPLILVILSTVVIVFIGLMGREMSEVQREWWSRLGAWIGIVSIAWLFTGAICFFGPLWVAKLGAKTAAAGITWGTITAAGLRIAASAASGRNSDQKQNPFAKALMNIAPFVFIAGFLVAIAFLLHYAMARMLDTQLAARFIPDSFAHQLCCTGGPFNFQGMVANYWALMYPASWVAPAACIAMFILSVYAASRVDVNEFSMHNLYKNRLVRAYLGASRSREHRWPNAFTGFDLDDDMPVSRLRVSDQSTEADAWTDCRNSYSGPFAIINTALNVSRGEDLGRQERKAESFIFTPLRSGFDFTRKQTNVPKATLSEYAFRPTDQYAYPKDRGISLGTAISISGAAANPNAGFHTSPSLAFLLTIFNVRLGWWLGNTRDPKKWKHSSPGLGLGYLLRELTGQTTSTSGFLQLSDGGHFDNMGLYELIRRRCRYIVVCDGEEDAGFKLEGIGGAIRKARVDFGAVVNLDLSALRPTADTKCSKLHYSVGTVLYSGEVECGILVYIKTSITGDEPVDLAQFRKAHPEFPNESTLNQFFDESHFESYRALGHHSGERVFKKDALAEFRHKDFELCDTLGSLFREIQSGWEKEKKSHGDL